MIPYAHYSDFELASLLKGGDERAFAEIYDRYKGALYVHAFNLLRDREEAKDILQQVFAILWDNRDSIELKTQLLAYLYTSVRNKIFNLIAHKKVESKYITSLAGFASTWEENTDHLVRRNQLLEIIDREITSLPEKMREVFELSRRGNLSHREIAELLGISEKTVKNQVNNSLKILRVKLGIFIYLLLLSNL
jgi:RNA polymerase sigma-70 factor (family 1)